jgi:chromosome segregation protein
MRLKEIKMAGFKSFVDATSIVFPNEMTAIVGPNGCGKSNTIDAVRWVMGESSAKQLRGEQMSDVIFNGSQLRKAVSVCSVELVFDNSDFSLQGEFSGFSEVSVKRKLSRDGQNHYYLNGTVCRRKDVTNLFLGTGLGPRSYAIIEQGMISKLIESKPEELRVFVEEAAGISRYKARRKESEQHIKRTHENVVRLEDIRTELQRQITKLESQAATAVQFKQFKQRQRELNASVCSLQWHELEQSVQQQNLKSHSLLVEQQKYTTENEHLSRKLVEMSVQQTELTDKIDSQQQQHYQRGNQLSRLEQSLKFEQEKAQTSQQQRSQWQQTLAQLSDEYEQLKKDIIIQQNHVNDKNRDGETLTLTLSAHENELQILDKKQIAFQKHWDDVNDQAQIQHIEHAKRQQQIQQLRQTIKKEETQSQQLSQSLMNETNVAVITDIDQEKLVIDQSLIENLEALTPKINAKDIEINAQKNQNEQETEALIALEKQHQTLNESLINSQKAYDKQETILSMLYGDNALSSASLNELNLHDCLELSQHIQSVSPQWQNAVNWVLQDYLSAKVSERDASTYWLNDKLSKNESKLTLIFNEKSDNSTAKYNVHSLMHQVHSDVDLSGLLGDIICCDDVFAYDLQTLQKHQSVIDTQGRWASVYFFKQLQKTDDSTDDSGAVQTVWQIQQLLSALEKEMTALTKQLNERENQINGLKHTLNLSTQTLQTAHVQLQQWRFEQQQLQQKIDHENEKILQHQHVMALKQAQQQSRDTHKTHVQQQILQLQTSITLNAQTLKILAREHELCEEKAIENNEKDALVAQKEQLRLAINQQRLDIQTTQADYHQWQLQQQQFIHQLKSQQIKQADIETSKSKLSNKLAQVIELSSNAEKIAACVKEIERQNAAQFESEHSLASSRAVLIALSEQEKKIKAQQIELTAQLNSIHKSIEQIKVQQSGKQVQQNELALNVENEGFELPILLAQLLGENKDQSAEHKRLAFKKELITLAHSIEALGAINLMAIDELATNVERKSYLDKQFEELNQAIDTLQGAIERIDFETQSRFKQTFEFINSGLAELFPKVFGGGSAWLEVTSDNWLDTGIRIMARPPGKKNSSIHLLSGGEKALTAIALVFAIFRLNPAPFCLLDEVDAPLDDSNVERYAKLVHAMSESVQFIYITHNKIAMEKAQDLMGVTMNEPGVSKLVSVSLQEAHSYVKEIKT